MKDVFVPSIIASGGVGASYGITLTVPTIFTINTQSLVFNYSQRDYIRSARMGLQSSTLALTDVREQVEEDTVITYLTLAHGQEMEAALAEEYGFASRLVSIVQERRNAGLESELELKQSRRTSIQIKLQRLQMQNEVALLREHLGHLIGLPLDQFATVEESLPSSLAFINSEMSSPPQFPDTPSLLSAEANARAKQERAFGDSRYTWRPQVTFAAQYGRVSPINDVSAYYNLHGNYNTAAVGVQIQVPFLDASHKARAQGSMADASRAAHEVALMRIQQSEDHVKLLHSLAELATRAELAEIDQAIAQDQLKAMIIQVKAGGSGGRPMTPKDEENARIQERQRYMDLIDANLQLRKSQIFLLRQTGGLVGWLQALARSQP